MSREPADDDVQLAAYLAGDLDELEAQRVTRRLADDEGYAARLDRLADTLVALRAPDEVEPPEGFRERLDARLAEARPRRSRRPRPATLGAAAAGVTALALVAGTLLGAPGGDRLATDDAVEQEITAASEDAAPREHVGAEPDVTEAPGTGPGEAGELDAGTVLGADVDDAPGLAERGWAALEDHGSTASLAACRSEVEGALDGPVVPAGVADTVVGDTRTVELEIITAAGGSAILDRVGAVVVDTGTCEVLDVDPG